MTVLSIDPGNEETAFVIYDCASKRVADFAKIPNQEFLERLEGFSPIPFQRIVVEFPVPRGELASHQLFDTIFWIGRYCQVAAQRCVPVTRVDRLDAKMCLCQSTRVKDSQIRQALIDRWGGESAIAGPKCPKCNGRGGTGLGKKRVKCERCHGTKEVPPGPLHGVSKDVWAALAIAVTFSEEGHLRRQREDEWRAARGLPTKAEEKAAKKERIKQENAERRARGLPTKAQERELRKAKKHLEELQQKQTLL